jgi:hypothetical protein
MAGVTVAHGADCDPRGHVEVPTPLGVEELAPLPVGEDEGSRSIVSVEMSLGKIEELAGHARVLPPPGGSLIFSSFS